MNILDIINVPLSYIIKFCYMIVPNYAVTLLLFAVILKILLFPFGIKQQKNMVKQAALTPKTEAIKKRYAGRTDAPTQQKMNEEIMELYKKENFNPMGGCLPMLIQFPILLSLYNVVTQPLHYLCNVANDTITTIGTKIIELNSSSLLTIPQNISIPETVDKVSQLSQINIISVIRENFELLSEVLPETLSLASLPDFTVFGNSFDLSVTPSFKSWLVIIPILSMLSSFFSMKLTRKFSYQPATTDASTASSMKMMDLTMPLFSLWIAFSVPAVIAVYWIYQNILGVVQQIVLSKLYPIPVFSDEELKRVEKEMNGSHSLPKKEKKKVRSLHHIDDEDYDELPLPKSSEEKKAEANDESTENSGLIQKAALKDDSDRDEKNKKNRK